MFEGEFERGLKSGPGKMMYKTGNRVREGTYADDKEHGKFKYQDEWGEEKYEEWEEG